MIKNIRGSNIKNIRTYIMGLIYKNGFSSVKVPSSMELAREFGVTRRTARMALESLIAEGFLTTRSGIGTFTNPQKGFKLNKVQQKPLIGLCFGDGSFFYYDAYTGKLFSEVMSQLLDADFNVYPLVHSSTDPALIIAEIECAGLDGAVFCNAPAEFPAVKHLLNAGKPCVAVRYEASDADFVYPDTREVFEKLFALASSEGRKHITVLVSEQPGNHLTSGINAARKSRQHPVEVELIQNLNPAIYANMLEEIFSRKEQDIPDMLVLSWRAPETAMAVMQSKGIPAERCKLIIDSAFSLPENFSGYDINVSYHDMAKAAVELLECRFRQPELPPQTSIVKGTLAKIEPGGEKLIL